MRGPYCLCSKHRHKYQFHVGAHHVLLFQSREPIKCKMTAQATGAARNENTMWKATTQDKTQDYSAGLLFPISSSPVCCIAQYWNCVWMTNYCNFPIAYRLALLPFTFVLQLTTLHCTLACLKHSISMAASVPVKVHELNYKMSRQIFKCLEQRRWGKNR